MVEVVLRPRLHGEAVQSVPWEGHEESSCPSPANMEPVLAIEMPHQGDGAIGAALFVVTEVDGSEAAVCGHLHGPPVALGESVGGDSIGGLALPLHAGEERTSLES